jgi:hypothetical protein
LWSRRMAGRLEQWRFCGRSSIFGAVERGFPKARN